MRLQNKRILITGASSGIGEAMAKACAREGADVILLSHHLQDLQKVTDAIRQSGGKAHSILTDLSQQEQVDGLIPRLEREIGEIDTLINNAGLGWGGMIPDVAMQDLRLVFEVNFFGMFNLCKQALTVMGSRRRGHIINVTSASGRFGLPGVSAYAASKGACHTFTSGLRVEGRLLGVYVTEALPISVSTPFFDTMEGKKFKPKGVVQTPEKVAESIVRCVCSRRPKAEVLPFPLIRLAFVIDAMFPGLLDRLLGKDHE